MNREMENLELQVTIHNNLRLRELKLPRFFGRSQSYLQERSFIIQWLHSIACKFDLQSSTIAVAMTYLDQSSDLIEIPGSCFLLAALACLLVGAKMEEQEIYIPSLPALINATEGIFSIKELQVMETAILDAWQWNVVTVTAMHFVDFYAATSICSHNEGSLDMLVNTSSEIILKAIQDGVNFFYRPSIVAAGAVVCARVLLNLEPHWPLRLQTLSGIIPEESEIGACCRALLTLLNMEDESKGSKLESSPQTAQDAFAAMLLSPVPAPF